MIDGQQRLTTLTLLLIALRDHIREIHWDGEDPTPERIDAYFLKNVYETGDRSYKLALRRHDGETLRALVDGDDPSEAEKNSELVIDAYRYFKELLNSPEVAPDKVYRGIGRLNIVDVKLERHIDNPQLVFESLNSTGVALSQSDLIRNYLLMGLPEEEQTRLYNNYWSKLEMLFSEAGSAPDSFLRDYMALKKKTITQTRADNIYVEFKDFWPSSSEVKHLDTLLEDMVRFGHYCMLSEIPFVRWATLSQLSKINLYAITIIPPSSLQKYCLWLTASGSSFPLISMRYTTQKDWQMMPLLGIFCPM